MDFPQFPKDFSREARARVIDAEIRASRAVAERRLPQDGLRGVWYKHSGLGDAAIIVQYIMSVFAALAREACEMGKGRSGFGWHADGWSVDVVDRQAREFLRLTTIHAGYKYSTI